MPRDITPREVDDAVVLRFGGGLRTRASEDEIDLRECADGQNFQLDLQDRNYKNRKPFDLVATAPNASEIRGFVTFQHTDGTISMLVQAGATVYQWDGSTGFTSVGTVDSTAKLRGPFWHQWELDDKVIITDLNLAEEVYTWDGTTFAKVSFTKNDGSTAWTGDFRAKYCWVDRERAIFSNVHDNGTDYPHLIVGSKRSDFTIISNDQRPSSALNDEDPWFLTQPDLRQINGMVGSFNTLVTSSHEGAMFKLTGDTAQDFDFKPLYPRSGACGAESVVYVGNDIHYGRRGRIESLAATDRFGDVETNDLSEDIADLLTDCTGWTAVYNERNQRVYFFPSAQAAIYVLHKSLIGLGLSPWSKWTTTQSTGFNFSAVMSALDPSDGLEYVFAGDSSGNIYKLEGSGSTGDGGTDAIKTERLSGLFKAPLDAEAFNLEGWILYRKKSTDVNLTLRFEYAGDSVFNEEITDTLVAPSGGSFYGGDVYYGGDFYYSQPFAGKLTRRRFGVAGRSNEWQLRVSAETTADFEIVEIGVRFEAAS